MALSILYVGPLPPHRGGGAIMSAQVLNGLALAGHRVRAIAPITPEASDGDGVASAMPAVDVRRFGLPYFDTSPHVDRSDGYRELERSGIAQLGEAAIAAERPDVLVAGRESFAWHVPELASRHRIPWIVLVQGTTTFGILHGSYPEERARSLLERFRRADAVVVVAQHLVPELARLGVRNLAAVRNPVDVGRFTPRPRDEALARELGIDERDVVVAHLSNMKPLKRPLDLVHSARQALARNPSLLYLVVGGEEPLRGEVMAACAAHGLGGRFRFVDWIEHAAVPAYLSLADLVVMPSAAEAQALVYLETQAAARTLVASDIPGAREVVDDGETGILFRMGDVDDLTEKTLLAAGSADLRARIGAAARERVRVHSLERVVASHERVLERVAGGRR